MSPAARKSLAEMLKPLGRNLTNPEVQGCVREAYAQVWLHLLLSRGLDPRHATSVDLRAYQAVLPSFQSAGERIGLHNQAAMAWWAPEVARIACQLWKKAKAAQGEAPRPLPGLGLEPIGNIQPAWPKARQSKGV